MAFARLAPRLLSPPPRPLYGAGHRLLLPSGLSRAFSSSQPAGRATHLIRFIDESGAVRCGQRVDPPSDSAAFAWTVENDDPLGSLWLTGERAAVKKLLSPVAPSQILCIGLNYRKHAEETNMPLPKYPVLFTKGLNTVQHPDEPVVIPRIASDPPEVDYECELAVVLREECRDVSEGEALRFVGGYTCANDISARRWQGKRGGGQWCRAKTFDTFCPLGPVLVTPEAIPDPQTLRIATYLNGKTMQQSNTSDMIFSVAQLISQLSQDVTLPRGTVIITGTPEVR
jgi:2-keto-4-pentenoate hydratase/2-oxohepta-3-ene-1,7-dioic acid hydratase in catechol pathway